MSVCMLGLAGLAPGGRAKIAEAGRGFGGRAPIVAAGSPPSSNTSAGDDLLAQVGVGVAEALDEDVGRTGCLVDERGDLGQVNALVLAVLVEAGAPLEAALGDVDHPAGEIGERRAAER